MQHRSVMLSRGLLFFCISSLFFVGLLAVPAMAQDAGAGPPAGTPVTASNPDNPNSPPNLFVIPARGCRVSEGASITLEESDGTQATFVDGRGVDITATASEISMKITGDQFLSDVATFPDPSDQSFDTGNEITVVTTTGITCQDAGTTTADQTSDPLAGVEVTLEDTDGDESPDLILIPALGCRVAANASVTVRNIDPVGQPIELVNGQSNIRITAETNQLRIEREAPGDTREDIGGLDPGRGEIVRSTGIVCGPPDDNGGGGTDGSCPGARVVETLTGTASSRTPEFNITGTSFRVVYDVTRAGNPPLAITVLDANGGVVETLRVDQVGRGSLLVNEGPGRFVVETDATGAEYAITVEDCTGAGNNDANAAETQYNANGKKVTVIVETIPDKRILIDTGGPMLPMIGGVILAIGLVGLGIFLLRRT